ncbi:protein downstream neighbor of son homolog [Schistocerca gregaria]|uniref:protein downstream neighbor of son homolog n=1 Tax=Schistocerca gregaria TaxID=7010 RepID=UPI00211E7F92|nr:protein downstream neighbor of son homolog [Schistocerca gregaria]
MNTSQDHFPTSPSWKLPEDVMRMHRLKMKKRALQARLRGKDLSRTLSQDSGVLSKDNASTGTAKRKNPFRCGDVPTKRSRDNATAVFPADFETSCDNSLFQLLTAPQSSSSMSFTETSFSSILSRLQTTVIKDDIPELKAAGKKYIPVDWSLKTKMRFMSEKPFPWTQQLRTCEEASGTTGFVRCMSVSPNKSTDAYQRLDTSPSARFHQCCLVWMHPYLPWLQLFPRSTGRVSDTANSPFASDTKLRDSLHYEWGESLRSLFQLVRACQCPYFYVCTNTFTCLFRAAGIGGFSNTHAFVTPTTRGFRQLLKEEDVVFTMPLKKSNTSGSKRSSSEGTNSDMGYETQDSAGEDNQGEQTKNAEEQEEEDLDDFDDEDGEDWLHSMGMGKEEIRKLNSKQVKTVHNKEREVDRTPESLIYVEGVEAQAFFNFLMNCKSTVAASGPLAGVPPTLIAPVAFQGGTLRPIKVRQSVVKLEGSTYHSVELRGPILPHVLHDLCSILQHTHEEFSVTFAHIEQTRAFTMAAKTEQPEESVLEQGINTSSEVSPSKSAISTCPVTPTKAPSAFGQENLSDCGLQPSVLQNFCCADPESVELLDGLKYCSDGTYTWS